jgi:hypothetical protein
MRKGAKKTILPARAAIGRSSGFSASRVPICFLMDTNFPFKARI